MIFLFGVSATRQTSDQDSLAGQWVPAREAEPANPAEPSYPTESSPRLGSAPVHPWLSTRAAGTREWAGGSSLQGWALLLPCHGLASAGPAQAAPTQPLSLGFPKETPQPHQNAKPLAETASATGTGLQTECSVKGELRLIISTFHRDDSGVLLGEGEAAGAPQADWAGSTPTFQDLQVLNTLPFQDLGWAKDTLSFIKIVSEVTDHFGWVSWCFWEMQIYIKVIK